MKKQICIIVVGILILVISILIYFLYDKNKNTDTYISVETNIDNKVEYNNEINTHDFNSISNNENTVYSEGNELITDNIEKQSTNNSTINNTYSEQSAEKKENVNNGTYEKEEQSENVNESTKAELPQQETTVEIPETSEQETQIEIPMQTEQKQLDFSKYDRYYNAMNGGYTCFKKNPEEIAKLKSLIEDAIKEFEYENVGMNEDSSMINERYFTANKTNVQNVVYNSDYFTILYYAETEYGLTKDGVERINQIRSYMKVIGQ